MVLSAVAYAMHGVFALVEYARAGYLIWPGVVTLRARARALNVGPPPVRSKPSSFSAGFLITPGDPKAILFYMGLLPAFVDLSEISVPDTALVMLIATFAIGSVKGGYAYLAQRAKSLFGQSGIRRRFDVAAGALLMITGVFLLYSSMAHPTRAGA